MMAKLLLLLVLLTIATTTTTTTVLAEQPDSFIQSEGPAPELRHEKLTHLRVYWHDILTGSNLTSVSVAEAASTNTSSGYFGRVTVMDDPLTEGPETASKLVGRAQGIYVFTSHDEIILLMAMTFAFTEGKYNGSTISILGRNDVPLEVREMPVVGGTGLFRLARGYVLGRPYKIDSKTGNAVVEYNCFVFH